MLALGLVLVLEVRLEHLLSFSACAPIVLVVIEELVVLWDHTNHVHGVAATMYLMEWDMWCFNQKLYSEEATSKHRLHVEKDQVYP